jgi:signal transduction histidine kinase
LYTVLQDIEHEAKRCAEIVQNLLTFSHTERDDDKAYEKESLAEILDRVLKLLSYRIEKQGILVTQHIADDTPEIWMKPNSIQQLILNLATNAFDALEDSEKKEFNVDIHREDDFVRITIADTGYGIAAESLSSIFDPFFTTKPIGQGTGLGLSISQGIVKTHRGQISCESEPGAGTKFVILLPIEQKETSKQYEQANISN